MANTVFKSRRPRKSLRTILTVWSLLISVVPLMFVTGFSLVTYERAIDLELVQRLRANVPQFSATIEDFQKYLQNRRVRHQADTSLQYHLATNSVDAARNLMQLSMRNSHLARLSLFDRQGQLLTALEPDETNQPKENKQMIGIALADSLREALDKTSNILMVARGGENSVDLVQVTRLDSKQGRIVGYVEEIINIGPIFLENMKKRFSLEIILFDQDGNLVAGSHPDFSLYQKEFFAKTVMGGRESFFSLDVRDEPFRFIAASIPWGESKFLIGLGASKKKAQEALRSVSYAFFMVIGTILILLILTITISARVVLKPLSELVEAIQVLDQKEGPVQIPVKSANELGVLTESFNEMSQRVHQARIDLQKKISELESAYQELKETQARLVHSAKMASLGQLVAGVAHELNNPIGFIFSNMTHLRDYADRLVKIIETAEKTPERLPEKLKEYDFDYIMQDLPRLINSCEEGARRTRDIVLGLRNFSRLEEAKIKKVDLHEGLEQTLKLLSGELKTRIKVHTEFGDLPEVLCYPSQLNQVFMNILSNAAQAIESEGEIWIRTKLIPASEVGKPGAPGGGDWIQVSIRDSGKGMPQDVLDKIFDPFFTTKTIGQGTGLGLSISYGIVKNHGGEIEVISEPGKGTEFIVVLPVAGPIAA